MERVADVRKIAVLRCNGIGDLVFALPALDALRAAYREAEIALLAAPWHAALLRGRPGPVDRVIVVPPSRGVRDVPGRPEDPDELRRFFEAMAAERFDLALQLHGGGRHSNPFVRRLGARVTAGLRAPDAEALDRWVPYIYFQNEILRYLEVAALVGAPPRRLEPALAVTAADLAESLRAVPAGDRPLAALCPGATDPRRHWPPEKLALVGDALAAAGAEVAVAGSESDRALVARVRRAMRAPARDLAGRLSLSGLAGLFARCAVVVGNDTGPVHLAEAVGARTVAVYWCGNLITGAPLTRARHRPVASWRLECPVCKLDTTLAPCDHRASFVADVPVAEVRAHALALLEDARASRQPPPLAVVPALQGAAVARASRAGGAEGSANGGLRETPMTADENRHP